MALALGRGERGDRGRLEPAVLANVAYLLAALVERMASLARTIRMTLAKRRRQTVHRRRFEPAVLAVVVLHRSSSNQRCTCRNGTQRCNNFTTHLCNSFLLLHLGITTFSRKRKGGAACVSCRGDWYAQGDHARDAAKHATATEGMGPPTRLSAAETLLYSCPVLRIPFRTITSLSTGYGGILPHPAWTYKPPCIYTHGGRKV